MVPQQFYRIISSLLLVTHINHVKSEDVCDAVSLAELTPSAAEGFEVPPGNLLDSIGVMPLLGDGNVYPDNVGLLTNDDAIVTYDLNSAFVSFSGIIGLAWLPVECVDDIDDYPEGDHRAVIYLDSVQKFNESFEKLADYAPFAIDVTGATELQIEIIEDHVDAAIAGCILSVIGNPLLCLAGSCAEAGLDLEGNPHECECNAGAQCDEESRFCNSMQFVTDKLQASFAGDEALCGTDSVCCCSCLNCNGYQPL